MRGLCLTTIVIACGSPTNTAEVKDFQDFTLAQRMEDFQTITGIFEEHYAMMDYKQRRLGFDWQELKTRFKEKISAPKISREEFTSTMQEFVATMQDAHTSTVLARDFFLEGYQMMVTTLGFATSREIKEGKSLALVARVYDSFWPDLETAPIQEGDYILSIDGQSPEQIIKKEITPYRNLGQKEANLTVGFEWLLNRPNTLFSKLPKGRVQLEVKRGEEIFTIELDWIKTGLGKIQEKKSKKKGDLSKTKRIIEVKEDGSFLVQESAQKFDPLSIVSPMKLPVPYQGAIAYQSDIGLLASMNTAVESDYPEMGQDFVTEGLKFHLIPTEKGMVAIYRVEDFVWSRAKCEKVAEGDWGSLSICRLLKGEDYVKAFKKLNRLGVKGLILDLRSNGGGYLSAGYELFRAFAKDSLRANLASLRLNEDWLAEFKFLAGLSSTPESERSAFQRQYNVLEKDATEGKKMSSPIAIMGHELLKPTLNAWTEKTLILVDEKCASMCDIFTTLMQDHNLAKVIGKQSMGAGGNVIGFRPTPHTKIILSQTASIMYRLDGSVIENNGAMPDIKTDQIRGEAFWKSVQKVIEAEL